MKQFEKLNGGYNDCVVQVNNFNGKFDSDDLERVHQLQELQERLQEEAMSITGSKRPAGDEEDADGEGAGAGSPGAGRRRALPEDSLVQAKRGIIEGINGLVNQFNDITKMLRDSSGKSLKTENTLNDLI